MILTKIKKRNGDLVPFDPRKLNKWAEWGCSGLNVDWSEIALNAVKSLPDFSSTKQLQDALIRACVERTKTNPAYEVVAARLKLADIRKEVFGTFTPPSLRSFYHKMVDLGLWDNMGYEDVTLDKLDCYIDHSRDENLLYSALRQFTDKYAIRNRVTGKVYETPQFMMMGIAMESMKNEPFEDIIGTYDILSKQQINLPTPYLVGLRTPNKGFASCCLISGGDSIPSLAAAEHAAYMMTANRAGIGVELETRTIGDPVKDGLIEHQGKLPYYRTIDTAVKANTQQARGGSATVHFRCIDPQVEDLIRLKSQRVSDQSRIPFMDYSIGINDMFLKLTAQRKDLMLVSYYYAPALYDLMLDPDQSKFEAEYLRVLQDDSIPKKFVSAFDISSLAYTQRPEVGRVYLHRLDVMNHHTPFKDRIRMSNLCQEIALPTRPYSSVPALYGYVEDVEKDGEIALCFLLSIVAGRVSESEYERVCYLALKILDYVIDNADYPFESMRIQAQARRSVGVGITNLAHYLASNKVRWSEIEGVNLTHELAERQSYYLHRASLKLAKEKGTCTWAHKTKYADGWTHIDTYCKEVDKYHTTNLKYDWKALGDEIKAVGGLRNSVLEAIAPTESSSVFSCTTNGVDPIRQRMVFKSSRSGDVPFIVPDYDKYAAYYETAWELDNKKYAIHIGVLQKFTGQSISYNEYYDYSRYPNRKLPMKELLSNFLFAAKLGIKTWYYLNSKIGQGESVEGTQATSCESCAV